MVTLWSTEDASAAFRRVVAGHPLWGEFEACMEAGSLRTGRYETLD